MRKLLDSILFICLLLPSALHAQDAAVTAALQAKYGSAQWRTECRGWYLVSYNEGGTNFYAFADSKGNVIASNAVRYNIHSGFIEMQLFDRLKKERHDDWENDMRRYEKDYQTYVSKKRQYENEVQAYNRNVEAAKSEAKARWEAVRKQEYNKAYTQAKIQNSQARAQAGQGGSILGAIVTGVLTGVSEVAAGQAAANRVQYEPFENEVMAQRKLLTPPYEPYNPKPTKPAEPSDGFEWKKFPLLQPCPYTHIDYDAISDPKGFSKVLKNDRYWGVVDASLREVVPCEYSSVSRCGEHYLVCKDAKYGLMSSRGGEIAPARYSSVKYENDIYLVSEDGRYGIIAPSGKVKVPVEFEKIRMTNGYVMCRKNNLWGVYTNDFEELYPCQFQEAEFLMADGVRLLRTKVRGQWGLINFNSGVSVLPNRFSKIEPIKLDSYSAFRVYQENRMGIYYANGVILLPCEFSSANVAAIGKETYLTVKKGMFAGLYDLDGACIIRPDKYDSFDYKKDFFLVTFGSAKGVCSLFGEELVRPEYSRLEYVDALNGFIVSKEGKCGLVDIRGNQAFPMVEARSLIYDISTPDVLVINNGYKEYGAVNEEGLVVVKPKLKREQIARKVESLQKKMDLSGMHSAAQDRRSKLYDDYLTSQSVEMNRRTSFSFYAQNYVERIINDWQKRGEFEKMSDWQMRVNDNTRQQKVYALTKAAQDNFISIKSRMMPADSPSIVGRYDPDNETYQVKTSYSDDLILVNVPTVDAEEFKVSFPSLKRAATFQVKNNDIALADYAFTMPGGTVYKYRDKDRNAYSIAQVDYNFEKVDIGDFAGRMSTTSIKFGTSDVDKDIPVTDKVRENTFAVVIANENYYKEKDVEFAYNDGMAFRDYCVKAMGIPEANVHFKPNATLNDVRFEFNWIKKVAEDYKGEAEFVVYYAGHGVPDDASKEAYILPVDGNAEDLESAYKLSKLYTMLGEIPSKDVLVFLDACFSGSQRSGETLASARGVAITPRIDAPTGNVVVYSAVNDKETAFPYRDKMHGLFTYYLLKKMQSTSGSLSLGDLSDCVSDEVARKSIVVNSKPQHPTVSAAPGMAESWRTLTVIQ